MGNGTHEVRRTTQGPQTGRRDTEKGCLEEQTCCPRHFKPFDLSEHVSREGLLCQRWIWILGDGETMVRTVREPSGPTLGIHKDYSTTEISLHNR